MKKAMLSAATVLLLLITATAQDAYKQQLQSVISELDKAEKPGDYQQLAGQFAQLAEMQKTDWLPYYYAAFCNAKTGWLYKNDGEKIEPFANKADEQIKKSIGLLDTASHKKELSEIYCVLSMINKARVFINPQTFGPKYGPAGAQYIQLAKKVNANNPRAIYLEGWDKYYTPKMWGGDKKAAKAMLQQSLQLLNNNKADADAAPHWGKKEVAALLGMYK